MGWGGLVPICELDCCGGVLFGVGVEFVYRGES